MPKKIHKFSFYDFKCVTYCTKIGDISLGKSGLGIRIEPMIVPSMFVSYFKLRVIARLKAFGMLMKDFNSVCQLNLLLETLDSFSRCA